MLFPQPFRFRDLGFSEAGFRTGLFSVLFHISFWILFLFISTPSIRENLARRAEHSIEVSPYSGTAEPFTPNVPKPEPVVSKTPEKKAGIVPAKVAVPDGGKKGGSVSGFQGPGGGEEIGTKGTGEGAGSGGEGGTGQQGSDIYRVGVETMPEAYGGSAGIASRLPQSVSGYTNFSGRSVYILAFIDEQGIVRRAEVSKGVGNQLDAAAANAVRRTRFRPGKDKGKPVKVQMMINITIP